MLKKMHADHHHPVDWILDRLARPQLAVFNRRCSAYTICGCSGIALAVLLSLGLSVHQNLSFWVPTALTFNALLTFYALALATRIIAGEEMLIYYHHKIAIIITSVMVLWFLKQPILVYLDLTILGLGMFLACGRIGCLMVGCCHGGPHRWGIRYHRGHAAEGFENCLVGVRLFPVQALEAVWVMAVVAGGSFLVLKEYPPGEALAWYTMLYGAGRFCFEFLRGDSNRPYWIGFSEAQWTTVILIVLTMAAEVSGLLTLHAWHAALAIAAVVFMVTLIVIRHTRGHGRLGFRHPGHVKELAEIIDRLPDLKGAGQHAKTSPLAVGCTSTGVQISKGRLSGPAEQIRHYALSQKNELMTDKTARRLGTLVQQLRHPVDALEIMPGNQGVYHLLFHVRAGEKQSPTPKMTLPDWRPTKGARFHNWT